MKRYINVETGKEVKVGDVIERNYKYETYFGTISGCKSYVVTDYMLPILIKEGWIKEIPTEEQPKKENIKDVSYYVAKLADRRKTTVENTIEWLSGLNNICPKAVLDILLQTISKEYFLKDTSSYLLSDSYWSLRPSDGKVGKVHVKSSHIPAFKSKEEAEEAREILKDQLTFMYGEQKG